MTASFYNRSQGRGDRRRIESQRGEPEVTSARERPAVHLRATQYCNVVFEQARSPSAFDFVYFDDEHKCYRIGLNGTGPQPGGRVRGLGDRMPLAAVGAVRGRRS